MFKSFIRLSAKNYVLCLLIALAFPIISCEVEDPAMPDYEVGIVASAEITPGRYWFNAQQLGNSFIEFNLDYDGFGVNQASQITLFIEHVGQTLEYGSYTSFPTTISLSASEAYAFFGKTIDEYDADNSGRDEFVFTYTITTTDGTEFSQFGQYYAYNPSEDGRFTGKFGQFATNLPGFGRLIFDVRAPNPTHPNEN